MMLNKKSSHVKYDDRGTNICLFETTQYDFQDIYPGAQYACTSIAVLAGSVLLNTEQEPAKPFTTNEFIRTLIEEGCRLQESWVEKHQNNSPKGAKITNLAAVDEILMMQESPARADETCHWGQLIARDYGANIEDIMRNVKPLKTEVAVHVLTVHKHSTMIGIFGTGGVVVFDSHKRESKFGLAPGKGDPEGSILVRLKDTKSLIAYLKRLYCASKFPNSLFTLQKLTAEGGDKVMADNLIAKLSRASYSQKSTRKSGKSSKTSELKSLEESLNPSSSSNSLSSISSLFKGKSLFPAKRPATVVNGL
eukprot:CFRG1512T1